MTKERILAVVGVVAICGVMLYLAAQRDKAVMQAADLYEKCVKEQYGTTPTAWYYEHGEYPECRN